MGPTTPTPGEHEEAAKAEMRQKAGATAVTTRRSQPNRRSPFSPGVFGIERSDSPGRADSRPEPGHVKHRAPRGGESLNKREFLNEQQQPLGLRLRVRLRCLQAGLGGHAQ